MSISKRKLFGAYYTPEHVVHALVSWVVRSPTDRMLDPSCGDGRFLAAFPNSVGVEQDMEAASIVHQRSPGSLIHQGDFFTWAAETRERFDCAGGNPPFIRYQTFNGEVREKAIALCARLGANFSGLASSWAPFLVATASLIKPGGRMAFVVPSAIGHAPYAAPLLEYLINNFSIVHIIAVQKKIFSKLSEVCWLLYTEGFGGSTKEIRFSVLNDFSYMSAPPKHFCAVSVEEWRNTWNNRLRAYILPSAAREAYSYLANQNDALRFGELASIGIGYVTGANDFFHLRPSQANSWGIPAQFLHPTVRNSRALPAHFVNFSTVKKWYRNDEPVLLLRIPKNVELPPSVRQYLTTTDARVARESYKCKNRYPWYSVPDVKVPNFFLTYMSGMEPSLVRNDAGCTCTNSIHSVRIRKRSHARIIFSAWNSAFTKLSCELEGHALGGGMLKLEPREATRVILPPADHLARLDHRIIEEALHTMREWRGYVT